jgi:VWFA-related protein
MSSRSRGSSLRRRLRLAGCWAALSLAWILGPAAPAPAAPAAPPRPAATATQSFSETAEVTVVQVPVQVVRGGEPVRGLTAADFEVYDGRRKQTVTGFEVLDLAARQGPAVASIPPTLRRHFLFLFDLSFSEPKSLIKARQMVRDMLPSLHASDLVAVATYSSANGPRLVLGFTSDRRQVLKAVEHLGLPQLMDRNPDPLGLIVADLKLELQQLRGAAGDKLARDLEAFTDNARLADRANRQQQVALVRAFSASFADFARLLASVHGRKEVIYLSEGFDSSLLQGTEDAKEQADMADLSIHGQGYLTDSDKRYGDTRGVNVLEKMLDEFRRSDCVIQSVDIGGVRANVQAGTQSGAAPVRPSGEGTLFALAHDTGGELYRNFNDLGTAMGQMLKKTSITYVLTFQPDEAKRDGSYHKLRVELKGAAGKGAEMFFRPGYYAPRPYGQRSAREKLLAAAEEVVGGGDSGSVGLAVLVAPFRRAPAEGTAGPDQQPQGAALPAPAPPGANQGGAASAGAAAPPTKETPGVLGPTIDKAYVPVVIETDGAGLLAGSQGDALPAEIYAYAIDSTGAIQDFFTQSMRLDLAKLAPALRQAGLKFFGHLDLPPGEYNVRVLVRNGATGAYGLRAQPLVVPAFGQPGPVLLPPFFPEAPGRWVMVREAPRDKQNQPQEPPPYPFVVQERAYIPSSRPVLAAGQEAAVALVGYNLPAGGLRAQARVLAADGTDLGEGDLKIGRRESPDAAGEDRLTATFRAPQGLQPGEYQLVIVLTDAQGVAHNSATRFVVPAPAQGARG